MIARRNIRAVIHGVVAAALAVALIGCTSPFLADEPSGDDTGGLRISGVASGGVSTQTVFPSFELTDVASYEVSLSNGPSGSTEPDPVVVSSDDTGQISTAVEFEDLVPGDWTLTVEGYDAEPVDGAIPGTAKKLVSNGGETISITRGEYNETTVAVELLDTDLSSDGNGDWEVDITWPATDDAFDGYETTDVVTEYDYTLTNIDTDTVVDSGSGTDTDITLDETTLAESVQVLNLGGSVPPGAYFLDVELSSENAAPYTTVARYSEIWYVYENVTTSRLLENTEHVALTESDFSFGGGASISVNIETESDLETFFEQLDESGSSEVAVNEVFSISPDANAVTGTVRWKINGEYVADDAGTVDITTGDGTLVGRLTGVGYTDTDNDGTKDTFAFTPDHGATDDGSAIDTTKDFPAGVSILVTMEVEQDGLYYSGSHTVEVVQ